LFKGTFVPAVNYPVGQFPVSVAVGDFNADGKLDLVTANRNEGTVSVLLGNGDGTFQAPAPVPTPVGNAPLSVAVGDFNRDTLPDLAVANSGGNNISILLNTGNGVFGTAVVVGTDTAPNQVIVTDVNLDGKMDLVSTNPSSNAVSVRLGNGDGTFNPVARF